MKTPISTLRQFFKNDVFSALVAIALSVFVLASPATIAAEKGSKKPATAEQSAVRVNINRASIKDLMNLNGIGEKKAVAIVKYRNDHGKFRSIEQLTKVKGIGMALVERNRKLITL